MHFEGKSNSNVKLSHTTNTDGNLTVNIGIPLTSKSYMIGKINTDKLYLKALYFRSQSLLKY